MTAYNTSSTTIMVTWQRPQYPNGIIRGYQMSYTPQGGNASLLNISSANSSILLTGLQIYKVYNVSLRVLTAAYSNFSSVFSVSTDEGGKRNTQLAHKTRIISFLINVILKTSSGVTYLFLVKSKVIIITICTLGGGKLNLCISLLYRS